MIKQMFVLTEPIKSQQFDGGVNLYCGTFAILLIGIYIFNTKIKWYEKLKNVILIVFHDELQQYAAQLYMARLP